jgi:acyl-CoA thioesterase
MSFAALLASAERLADGFRVTIPPEWHQGRTAYGGFSTALALSAARQVGGDELPPLRSAQASMIGPIAGTVEARARVLRRGRNATWVAAEIAGEGGIGFTATFVFMGPVASSLSLDALPPPADRIAPDDARAFINERGPAFLRHHFDVRFAVPKSADKRAELCWWVRPRDAGLAATGFDAMVQLVLTADALPPGVMPLLAANVPVSTMQWQIDLLTPAPRTDGWWLLQSLGDYAADGAASQRMMLWNQAGEPMLSGLQSVALFG